MHKIVQLSSKFLYNKTKTCFLLFTSSLGELDEKPNHMKIQNLEILKKKVARERIFVNHLARWLYSPSSIVLALGTGHMYDK